MSLVGDGPATVLAIRPPESVALNKDAREGEHEVECSTLPPFEVGDAVGICDDRQYGWHGTHGVVQARNGTRVRLSVPLERALNTADNARAVRLFPAVHALDERDIEIRDLTIRGPENYRGPWWDFTYAAVHLVACRRVRGGELHGFGLAERRDRYSARQRRPGDAMPGPRLPRTRISPRYALRASVWSHNIAEGNGGDGFFFCARVHHTVCSDSVFSKNRQQRDRRGGERRRPP